MNLSLLILLVIISLVIGLAAFVWGLISGQFRHSDRARYLPFAGEEKENPQKIMKDHKLPKEIYILSAIIFIGLLIIAAPVLLTAYNILTR